MRAFFVIAGCCTFIPIAFFLLAYRLGSTPSKAVARAGSAHRWLAVSTAAGGLRLVIVNALNLPGWAGQTIVIVTVSISAIASMRFLNLYLGVRRWDTDG